MRKINTDLPYFIGSYSINSLIDKIQSEPEDCEISWNSLGGSVWSGQQFIDFLNNKENKLDANVTGIAASMGASILPFFDKVRGAKQADVMLHSISGGANVKQSNLFLYQALAKKIDEEKFQKITGHKLIDVMTAEGDKRFDVWFTGKDAGKMGLFDEVYDLLDSPKNNQLRSLTEHDLGYELPEHVKIKLGLVDDKNAQISKLEEKIRKDKAKLAEYEKNKIEQNTNDMEIKDVTASALENGNPEVYNAIKNNAASDATKAELDRVKKILPYLKYDFEKGNEIIESGKDLTIEDVECFMEKKYNKAKIDELEKGSGEAFVPAKKTIPKEEDEKFNAEIEAMRNESGVNEYLKK